MSRDIENVDLTSCVLNDKRALSGKKGSASTDKGIIVLTSYINLKLKNLITSQICSYCSFLRPYGSNIYESVYRMDLYKYTYAATNSFHISSGEMIEERVNEEKKGIPISTRNILDRKETSCYHEYEQK